MVISTHHFGLVIQLVKPTLLDWYWIFFFKSLFVISPFLELMVARFTQIHAIVDIDDT